MVFSLAIRHPVAPARLDDSLGAVQPHETPRTVSLARLASNDIYLAKKLLDRSGGEVRADRAITTHDVRGILTASEERRFNVIADSYSTVAVLDSNARMRRKGIIAATALSVGGLIMAGVGQDAGAIAVLCAAVAMGLAINHHDVTAAEHIGAIRTASYQHLSAMPPVLDEPPPSTAKTDNLRD